MDQLLMMTGVAGAAGQTIEGQVGARSDGTDKPATGSVQAFTFGDPEPVLDRRDLFGMCEVHHNGRWYEPPVSMHGLTRAFDMPGPHASCIRMKVNLLVKHFEPSRLLGRADFRKLALDFCAIGNGYLERRTNIAGRPMALHHSLGRYTRRGVEEGRYFFVQGWRQEHEFEPGSVFHMLQEHPAQEIYGVPEFFHALQSGLLGEAATLFRRRYYLNGSHAGFVFYLSEETMSNEDADGIRKALKESKGVGNFRNLFIHAPKGKKDGVQIIPISEVAAKDEFLNIKRVSRDDILSAHRVPPQLIGVVPENSGGFGDVSKAIDAFFANEVEPLEMRFLELNDWMGEEVIRFRPYERQAAIGAASAA